MNGRERHPDSHSRRQAVCDALKGTTSRFFVLDSGRILEAPVDSLRITGERRTRFGCSIAHGDHLVEPLSLKLVQVLRVEIVGIHVKACFEDISRQRVHLAFRIRSGAEDVRASA
jgi:hypothetical protein